MELEQLEKQYPLHQKIAAVTMQKLAQELLADDDLVVLLQSTTKEIIFIDNILEAYEGLGISHTINGENAEIVIHVTDSTVDEVLLILEHLPAPCLLLGVLNKERVAALQEDHQRKN